MEIISITPISEYHPAVGYTYLITLSDNSSVKITDDELMEKYPKFRGLPTIGALIGKTWK